MANKPPKPEEIFSNVPQTEAPMAQDMPCLHPIRRIGFVCLTAAPVTPNEAWLIGFKADPAGHWGQRS